MVDGGSEAPHCAQAQLQLAVVVQVQASPVAEAGLVVEGVAEEGVAAAALDSAKEVG